MSAHNVIVLTSAPVGRFLEGYISGTPKPGTCVQVKAAVEMIGGRHTWEVAAPGADGGLTLIAILMQAWWLGKTKDDAYASGDRCQMYCPIPGDEVQVLLQNQAGTADAFAIGSKLILDNGTGMFIADTGTPASKPFVVAETLAAITADTLCHCYYTGH